jgi:putative ABC transport system permease protein
MNLLRNLLALIMLAAHRIWHQRVLMGCLFLGMLAATSLSVSIPLYADAVHFSLLQEQLVDDENPRPPFAFLFRYIGAWHGPLAWEAYGPIDAYLTTQAPDALDLPARLAVRHVRTDNFRLFPGEGGSSDAYGQREPLLWTSLAFISDLEQHIDLLEGQFPQPDGNTSGPIDLLASQALAEKLGLQVGEQYLLFDGDSDLQLPIRIAGIWRPRDPAEPFWFYAPDAFDEILLLPEETFVQRLAPALANPVYQSAWYQVFADEQVRSDDVPGLLGRVAALQARAAALLPNIGLDVSPVEALQVYRREARQLVLQLTIFALPVFALLLYFVALIGGLVVQRRQNEIAVLRSRGATRWQVVSMHLVEGLLLGAVCLPMALALGAWLARRLGASHTFLDLGLLTQPSALSIVWSSTALLFAGAAVLLSIVASLLPSFSASRHTIVTYKQEVARSLHRPAWQRFYLDCLLLLPALYGYFMLRQQGTLLPLSSLRSPLSSGDLFQNPLLFVAPVLFCFALALLFIRLFPTLMGIVAWLAGRLPGAWLVLALRHLARSAPAYTGPLALLTLTLSLAAFTGSMALTLDRHLTEQVYYQIGADLRLVELGESTETPEGPGVSQQPAAAQELTGPKWLFLPVSEHLRVPGVEAAARVGEFTAVPRLGDNQSAGVGRLLGVDRVDFGQVAFFRPDFAAGQPLVALMNGLASGADRVLVSRSFLDRHSLTPGDRLVLNVQAFGERAEIPFVVAGAFDLFPSTYPTDGPVFVANLDYIHDRLGEIVPYDVWLRLAEQADPGAAAAGVRSLGLQVLTVQDARGEIVAAQSRPARQGAFGLLSVGFLAAAGLAILGFLVYSVVSFQRRFVELGMLRAIGLSVAQMALFLLLEQTTILLTGALVGTALGIWTSKLFIPFLQIGPQTPPFVVRIAWNELWLIYALFAAMLALVMAVLAILLLRMRLFEAVKLGEAV